MIEVMKESFMSIADTRQQSQVRHELYEIIAMTIAAVIGNCDGWDEIEDFCHSKEAWLREHMGLKLEHGIPSETTFARVWGRIDPDAFKRCFSQWTNRIREKLPGEVINIDGKTACGSRSTRRKAIHMISAWATEQELVLRQMCVAEKTNEISSVPLLLELLDVSGCIVTADAMNCQREIAKKITDGEGDYVLSLKENQPTLYEYAETYFRDALEHPQWYPEMRSCETLDKGHGRIEKRMYYLSPELSGLEKAQNWPGLAGIGMVCSHVTMGETKSFEVRYAITSLKSVSAFAYAMRNHWGIENGLHHCLDVSFHEDRSRIRKDHSPDNLAVVRHFALSALKQLPLSERFSVKRRRKVCAYDLDLLASAVDLILL